MNRLKAEIVEHSRNMDGEVVRVFVTLTEEGKEGLEGFAGKFDLRPDVAEQLVSQVNREGWSIPKLLPFRPLSSCAQGLGVTGTRGGK